MVMAMMEDVGGLDIDTYEVVVLLWSDRSRKVVPEGERDGGVWFRCLD